MTEVEVMFVAGVVDGVAFWTRSAVLALFIRFGDTWEAIGPDISTFVMFASPPEGKP